ncbi:MAG TPA: peptidoglycan-binding protein, partial [Hyphomicrobiaceae bacterium]|nr:peptidoglycan-binding protein [Hyphomicrobiaceae bacterium]
MARGKGRRTETYGEFWPGYVDVLSTLLLTVTFLMSVFMISQYFVGQEASGKDSALRRLTRQIAELTSLLSLEKGKAKSLEDELATLQASLSSLQGENARLAGAAGLGDDKASAAAGRISILSKELADQKEVSSEALAKVDLLNQQLIALRRQMAALNEALAAAEAKDKDAQARITDLGARLNVVLARQVQELQRYRSDFFGRLREILGNRPDVRVVGDRFVLQSEVFFDTGKADLKPEGRPELDKVADALLELEKRIPADLAWVLRIDGHT